MGHGYFCVVAYGIIISIEKFVKQFPESFEIRKEDYQRKPCYQPNYVKLKDIEKEFNISFHYEQQDSSTNIFICSKSFIIEDARCGGCQDIDIAELSNGKDLLEKFIDSKFPGKRISLKMYSYEGS